MSTRDRILDAAHQVMAERGLARATTKEIARAAGYSEATLYKHFRDKTDLFVAVLSERAPSALPALMAGLPQRAGSGDLAATLEEVASAAIAFYTEAFPMSASIFSEPDLLEAHRAALRERGAGPGAISHALAAYLEAERRAGRLAPGADPASLADLLLGACFQHAFLSHFPGPRDRAREPRRRLARDLVAALLAGAAPH
ncbi:TetR/AcrR family transcriptional regulator [Streptomonospora sp. PA3]|uniref:TetR family transcriptional regulator n=1 Tax=Streptomonospora sp. PA3 TaxID=2607326 RepID=UPI00130B308D|nr:TetR/AcrR family transcriptional regulator [Streptomonospora sp. PA3]